MISYSYYQTRKSYIRGKIVIGIDPAKARHQAVIIDENGIRIGKSFSFSVNYRGFHTTLWEQLSFYLPTYQEEDLIFAIECSCNLWCTITHYLISSGYEVVLVSPLSTYHSRVLLNNDFSRTDPKDALLIAINAQRGHFNFFRDYSHLERASHDLSIAYDKLRKDLIRQKNRLRAALELIFPEFLEIITLGTRTCNYLLAKYLFPEEFLKMNICQEAVNIAAISRNQYGLAHLQKLVAVAGRTTGISCESSRKTAKRLIIHSWLSLLQETEKQRKMILKSLLELVSESKEFAILTDIKGISKMTASLFIAEVGNLSGFTHYKCLEKFAGYNLFMSQSGKFVGRRHISRKGNNRLRWILYRMTEETMKHIPEVRIKYLKRQMQKQCYRKHIVACVAPLLKLIYALLRDGHFYEYYPAKVKEMEELNTKYEELKTLRKSNRKVKIKQEYKLTA